MFKKWIILSLYLGVLGGCKESEILSLSRDIVFVSDRDGNKEIYMMDINEDKTVRLTYNPGRDWMPSWSPDGKKIAFLANDGGKYEQIYTMNADGTEQRPLTNNTLVKSCPYWSPDGKKIAFIANGGGKYGQIYTMNADGTEQRPLTNSDLFKSRPCWSPDGKKIAFFARISSFEKGEGDIYLIDSNGENIVKLTDNNELAYYGMLSWFPDGTKIIFQAKPKYEKKMNIYIMDINSRNQSLLIKNGVNPCLSPDGKKIAFERIYKVYSWQIYLLDLAKPHQKERLLTKPSSPIDFIEGKPIFPSNCEPCWSCDGKYIAFISAQHYPEGFEIYMMDANGKNKRRLTNHPAHDMMPSWRPMVKEEERGGKITTQR